MMHSPLIDQYYALLRDNPGDALSPSDLHERGALLVEIRDAEAFTAVRCASLEQFCRRTQKHLGAGSYAAARSWIAIYEGFSRAQLLSRSTSKRALLAVLKVPRRYRGPVLDLAERLHPARLEVISAALARCTTPAELEARLRDLQDPPERRAAPREPAPTAAPSPPPPPSGADPIAADDPLYDRLDQNVGLPSDSTELEHEVQALLADQQRQMALLREVCARWEDRESIYGTLMVRVHQAAREGAQVADEVAWSVNSRAHEAELEAMERYQAEQQLQAGHQLLRECMVTVGESAAQTQLIGTVSAQDAGPLSDPELQGASVLPLGVSVNGGETITIIGDKRFGKSGTAQVLIESAADKRLQRPAGVVVFLYNQPGHLPPDILAALRPAPEGPLAEALRRLQLSPQALRRVVYLAPRELLEERRAQFPKRSYPNLIMRPLKLTRAEVKATTFQRMLGAELGNNALYLRRLTRDFLEGRSLDDMLAALDGRVRSLAEGRLGTLEDLLWEGNPIGANLQPGTVVVVELSGLYVPPADVMPIFSGLTDIFLRQKGPDGQDFHKMVVLEEGHLMLDKNEFGRQMVTLARLCRHLLATFVIISQDCRAIPDELIHLSSLLFVHRIADEKMAKKVLDRLHALRGHSAAEVANLAVGQALVAAQSASHPELVRRAAKVWLRPPRSAMGGGTRFAL